MSSLLTLAAAGLTFAGALPLLFIPPASAADLCFPGTGFTATRHIAFTMSADPRITYFRVERRLVFPNAAMPGWASEPNAYFEDFCTTKADSAGRHTATCLYHTLDAGSIYRFAPCNDAGCAVATEEKPGVNYIPACHVGADATGYVNLPTPPDCS